MRKWLWLLLIPLMARAQDKSFVDTVSAPLELVAQINTYLKEQTELYRIHDMEAQYLSSRSPLFDQVFGIRIVVDMRCIIPEKIRRVSFDFSARDGMYSDSAGHERMTPLQVLLYFTANNPFSNETLLSTEFKVLAQECSTQDTATIIPVGLQIWYVEKLSEKFPEYLRTSDVFITVSSNPPTY